MKKKLLFIIPEYSIGGTNTSLENLLMFMDTSKYDISIYCMYEDGGRHFKDVFKPYILRKSIFYHLIHDNPITRKFMGACMKINKKARWNWLYKREVGWLQKKNNFNTVIGFQEGNAIIFASYFRDCKKIAWIQCDYPNTQTALLNRDKDIITYSKFDNIVTVSKYTSLSLAKHFPIYAKKICYIYNTIKTTEIKKKAEKEIERLEYQNDIFNIISVGRFASIKQFDKIPEIANSIRNKTGKPFKWYIMASGDQCKEQTIKEIKKYGLQNVIILLGARENPYPYIKHADLLVCTSESESFSYVINEAKALHTPVVSNNFPVAYEVLEKECGWICAIDEMPTLLHKIINNNQNIYSDVKTSILNYEYPNEEIINKIERML